MRGVRPLSASSAPQAVLLIVRGATLAAVWKIAVTVGIVLTLVNQGPVLVAGRPSVATWLRLIANFVIPYVVSSLGYLGPLRLRRPVSKEPKASSVGASDPRDRQGRGEG